MSCWPKGMPCPPGRSEPRYRMQCGNWDQAGETPRIPERPTLSPKRPVPAHGSLSRWQKGGGFHCAFNFSDQKRHTNPSFGNLCSYFCLPRRRLKIKAL